VLSFIFLEILEKIAGMTKITPQKMNHDLLENGMTDFSLISHTSCVGWVVQIVQVSSLSV